MPALRNILSLAALAAVVAATPVAPSNKVLVARDWFADLLGLGDVVDSVNEITSALSLFPPEQCTTQCNPYSADIINCANSTAAMDSCMCSNSIASDLSSCGSCMNGLKNETYTNLTNTMLSSFNEQCQNVTGNNGSWVNTTATAGNGLKTGAAGSIGSATGLASFGIVLVGGVALLF